MLDKLKTECRTDFADLDLMMIEDWDRSELTELSFLFFREEFQLIQNTHYDGIQSS